MNIRFIAKHLRVMAEELEGTETIWSFKRRKVGSFIASIILASRKDDYIRTLERQRPDLDSEEISEELISLSNPKKEKMALYWICKKNLELPKDLEVLNQVYSILEKTHKDFQNYQSPKEILESQEEKIQKHVGKSNFNPSSEPTFSNPVKLEKGIVIYEVEDSKAGQLATRRAIDVNWGIEANPWCLAARNKSSDFRNRDFFKKYGDSWWGLSKQERDEIDEEWLKKSWETWKYYSGVPKRIAFQNGKLLAFFANEEQTGDWWDKQDQETSLYELTGVHDPLEEEYEKKLEELKRKKDLADNPNTPGDVLRELVKYRSEWVKISIASNPNTPEDVLRELAKYENEDVRENAAQNPNTPVDVLRELVKDKDENIRIAVADNSNTPKNALIELARDKERKVRYWTARNPNTPEDALMELARDEDRDVRIAVTENPNTPKNLLNEFVNDKSEWVRWSVAENPNTPEDILKKLAKDKNKDVRQEAKETLKKLHLI